MTEPLMPGTDIVAVGWLKLIAGLPTDRISTKLPKDDSLLRDPGFIATMTVGGTPGVDMPWRSPVVSADCWAAPATGSTKLPWGVADQLAERILSACYDGAYQQRKIVFTGPLAAYAPAHVATVIPVSEPRRIDDGTPFARFSIDLLMNWRLAAV